MIYYIKFKDKEMGKETPGRTREGRSVHNHISHAAINVTSKWLKTKKDTK